jgi:16S rRNA (adenine1518-N6/adenine1519-N6)-dimethyltransferase
MRQKLGQHFLINPGIPDAIAAALEIAAGDTVIEVGPGHGELTQAILAATEAGNLKDVKIIAVEKDLALATETRQRFEAYPFLEVIEADILEFLADPARGQLLKGNYKIVGNLPYYLTGHLLRIVSELEQKPALSIFMVQKEVAERLAAKPPKMNRLAASVQFWAEPKVLFYVSKNDFDPPPEVDSAVVLLRPRSRKAAKEQDGAVFYETVREVFAQPRKTIFNNLRKTFAARELSVEAANKLLEDAGIDSKARPQDLSLDKIEDLATRIRKLG